MYAYVALVVMAFLVWAARRVEPLEVPGPRPAAARVRSPTRPAADQLILPEWGPSPIDNIIHKDERWNHTWDNNRMPMTNPSNRWAEVAPFDTTRVSSVG